jgi:DNA excision repair protein ERCC-2
MDKDYGEINISVRDIVEFIMRSGDMDNTKPRYDPDAMQAGSRLHRKLQKQMDEDYTAEVPLSITLPLSREGISFELTIEGRADGIIHNSGMSEDFPALGSEEEGTNIPEVIIDEIKGMYMDLSYLKEPVGVHRAQAMCYAYMYAVKYACSVIGIRMTYCNLNTESIKYFEEVFPFSELKLWFERLTDEYAKWTVRQIKWIEERNKTIKELEFPFPYREGQKELAAGVYRTILRKKKLFIEAPTGVGKTISAIYPSVKAMGEGIAEKVFYLTAKTVTRTVAEDTFRLLRDKGLKLKAVTITAKEKVCILDKPDCNPASCERAKGYYDRINDAVYDLLINENDISRDLILSYAEKHLVCPFEMCLDVALWADAIICDYNYAFDPNAYLRRFFASDKQRDYIFLIDEAHNLADRAREMFSAVLFKEDFLEVKKLLKESSGKLIRLIDACNKDLLLLKRNCVEFEVIEDIGGFCMHLISLISELEAFMQDNVLLAGRDKILSLYLDIRHFIYIFELLDDNYTIYTDYDLSGRFRIKLQCMDPSGNLKKCMEKGRSAIMFSATLLPINYYKEQLGGEKEDYAIYAPSSFSADNRLIMAATDVSTKYSRRSEREYRKIISYINDFVSAKTGNYMVFFPSYQMLYDILELAGDTIEGIAVQSANMSEAEKEAFLEDFIENPTSTRVGFCVMGGIFSEGIDLKNSRLIGAVVVGTGLPMVCNERELFREYFDAKNGMGFEYAYLYHGMNKVLQSAGRVIRTKEDRGVILLLDERFTLPQYNNLFPREWFPYISVRQHDVSGLLYSFWNKEG